MFKFSELLSKVSVKDTDDIRQEDFNVEMTKAILKNLPEDRKPR
jgi:hypothetical protein